MQKIKCTFSYDGTNFSGSQIQPNKRTVQAEMEKALSKIHKGNPVRLYPSGRTDSGVHARGQVAHFDTRLQMPPENWQKALNALLPNDLFVVHVEEVEANFHAQFDAMEKEYRYIVLNKKERDVFKRNYMYYYPYPLQIEKIQQACKLFEGTHDFTSFCSARSTVKGSKVRTLNEVRCEEYDDEITFILRGNGFLYNMVRIIVGVLLEVGSGKTTERDIEHMLAAQEHTFAVKTAPPEGLYLWHVKYENN